MNLAVFLWHHLRAGRYNWTSTGWYYDWAAKHSHYCIYMDNIYIYEVHHHHRLNLLPDLDPSVFLWPDTMFASAPSRVISTYWYWSWWHRLTTENYHQWSAPDVEPTVSMIHTVRSHTMVEQTSNFIVFRCRLAPIGDLMQLFLQHKHYLVPGVSNKTAWYHKKTGDTEEECV